MSASTIHVNSEVITIVGTSEELIALAEAIMLKAKHPDTMNVTLTDEFAPISVEVLELRQAPPIGINEDMMTALNRTSSINERNNRERERLGNRVLPNAQKRIDEEFNLGARATNHHFHID